MQKGNRKKSEHKQWDNDQITQKKEKKKWIRKNKNRRHPIKGTCILYTSIHTEIERERVTQEM